MPVRSLCSLLRAGAIAHGGRPDFLLQAVTREHDAI